MKFFNIANHDKAEGSAVIQIMEQIGYNWWTDKGIEATDFINEVRALGELKDVFLEINSPGGNVFDGVSIANFIKSHPAKWNACVIGQAASIATVISSACDTVEMGMGTNFLVHAPMSPLNGYLNAAELRSIAKDLDTIENSVIDFYLARVTAKGKSKDQLMELMKEDRYMSADEAIEWGFVDSKSIDIKAVAFSDAKNAAMQGGFQALVESQREEIAALKTENEEIAVLKAQNAELLKPPVIDYASTEAIAKSCTDNEVPYLINQMIEAKLTKADFEEKMAQVEAIKAICVASELAPESILAHIDKSDEMLKIAISEAIALHELEQDPSSPSGLDNPEAKALDANAIYEKRNNQNKG